MPQHSSYEVVVVGGGSAGVAAAARLKAAGLSALLLEAGDRLGGRAHTVTPVPGIALDLGCSWLHSARQNEWAAIAPTLGFTVDSSDAPWMRPALNLNFPLADQKAYRKVFQAFEDRMEQAAEGPDDVRASDLIRPEERRWAPLLNAFSGYYNGASFDHISVKDYAAYQPTDDNWRVREGYGALIAAFAGPLDVRLRTPVRVVRHGGPRVSVETAAGAIEARAVIVCVSTTVLAEEGLRFEPPLPAKREAAHALPLGHVEKAFIRLLAPEEFPVEHRLHGRTDTADTASYGFRPLGMPVVEAFFGGDVAGRLTAEGPGALTAFAVDELVAVFGSDLRARLAPAAESSWSVDPLIRGAYSHARVGHAGARAVLAEPVDDRLFFAGEACSPHAFSTAHGAYETGVAAAEAAITALGAAR
jgi:monoamine oxidase